MIRRGSLLVAAAALLAFAVQADPAPGAQGGTLVLAEDDRAANAAALAEARQRGLDRLPFAQRIQAVAQLPVLLGRPYRAGTLEGRPEAEPLRVSFSGYDCVTFVETVLALSRTLDRPAPTADDEAAELAALRYRHGQPAYCERLHYFSDWIRRNTERGAIADVTAEVAGTTGRLAFHALPDGLNFMSRHAAALPALADSPQRQDCVRGAEQALSATLPHDETGASGLWYVDRDRLGSVLAGLRGGDLLALVAATPGLDVVHVGLVLDGATAGAPKRFVHASSKAGRVTIADTLAGWLESSPRTLGAIVLRPLPPPPDGASAALSPR